MITIIQYIHTQSYVYCIYIDTCLWRMPGYDRKNHTEVNLHKHKMSCLFLKISRPVESLGWAQLSIRNPVVAGRRLEQANRGLESFELKTRLKQIETCCKVARTGFFFVCLSPAAIFWRERPSEWPVSSALPPCI